MLQLMPGLKRLHLSMRRAGTERARFTITHNHVTFDCLFLTDIAPYEFVLAAVGHPGMVFVFDVLRGYMIQTAFADALYRELANLLRTGIHSGNVLKPSDFLRQIDDAVPADVGRTRTVTTADVLRTYRHLVDEDQKIYFKGWLRNPDGKHVKPENLDKTKRCFGQQVHDSCQRQNISSCWSPLAADEVAFHPPPSASTAPIV